MGVLECIKILEVSYECRRIRSGVVYDGVRNMSIIIPENSKLPNCITEI